MDLYGLGICFIYGLVCYYMIEDYIEEDIHNIINKFKRGK